PRAAAPAPRAAARADGARTGAARPPTGKTLVKLRRLLEEERQTYLRQAEELAAEAEALATDREAGDTQFDEESGEGDTLNVERERDLALSASANQAVEEIDRALRRMDLGTYGVCERCGAKIPAARLEALPYAALCINCKSREERRR
ncbi:MAG: TraR/DksA family transcriptional regulator, partial [Acidimicrobiia bacterium]